MKIVFSTLIAMVFAIGFGSARVSAQSFTTPHDTITAVVNAEGKYYNKITNTTANPISIKWKIVADDFPTDWRDNFSTCDNKLCESGAILFDGLERTTDPIPAMSVGEFYVWPVFKTVSYGTHYVKINMNEGLGGSKESWYIFTKNGPSSVSTVTSGKDVILYPNPAANQVTVLHSERLDVKSVVLTNLSGQAVVSSPAVGVATKLDVAELPKGLYFVRLVNGEGAVVATAKLTHD